MTKQQRRFSKRTTIIGVIALTLGIVSIIGVSAVAYINITNEKPVLTVEQNSNITTTEVNDTYPDQAIATGTFKDGDAVHQGSGTAKIVTTSTGPKLLFENFSTIPGPDLFVYLSPNAANEDLGEFVSLGKLKSISGDQVYDLPENYQDYKTVVVWCRAFSVTFTFAELTFNGS
jgi:hypothetical protein